MRNMFIVLSALASGVPVLLMAVAAYVLTALALYTIAQRRGIDKPWLAWVPVANVWILGSLSDQYQYLVKGQIKSKRKILLILRILSAVLGMTVSVLGMALGIGLVLADGDGWSDFLSTTMTLLGLSVPMLGIQIAATIIEYMALFDVYRSLDPNNSLLFLVLSIFVGIVKPFFLFFSRNRDTGMPPRKRPEPVSVVEAPEDVLETE